VLGRVALAVGLLAACESPSDVVVDPPTFAPVEDEGGRFRVTWGSGQDGVRGFLPDGRLLFRTLDLVPFGEAWILASAPLEGGLVREEVAVYRPAVRHQMGTLVSEAVQRVLGVWQPASPGVHSCPAPAPRTPTPVAITLYALPETDGVPVASLPSRYFPMTTVVGAGTTQQRVRVNPAVRDADRDGANPFGPVLLSGSTELIYSDGEQLWRASVTDTATPPVLIGPGAYPALSPDRRTLAYSRPIGLDSTVSTFSIPLGLVSCNEEHVEVTAASWEIVLRDLASGSERILGEGRDPAFDPNAARLVARSTDLRWLDVGTGAATPIRATTGAFAPAMSADGGILAFSLGGDVYFLRLDR
jgi:hypothetical protein